MFASDFEDRVYDVYFEGFVGAGLTLNSQAVQLRNVDAPWFLTGLTITFDDGIPAITIRDALGRACSQAPISLQNQGSFQDQSVMGSLMYLKFPQNQSMLIDMAELGGVVDCNYKINFRGFKRYRKGEAPCP